MRNKTKRSKANIPVYRQLRFRLIFFFMIPVLCIVVLGVVSYQKASDGIIARYETSVSQTMHMMNEYLNLSIDTVRTSYKGYLNKDDLTKYFQGLYDSDTAARTNLNKSYAKELNTSVNGDALISNIYMISDSVPSITTTQTAAENLYSAYTATPEGVLPGGDRYNYYLFGNLSAADESLGTDASKYSLRLVRGFNNSKTLMVIDISKDAVVNTLSSLFEYRYNLYRNGFLPERALIGRGEWHGICHMAGRNIPFPLFFTVFPQRHALLTDPESYDHLTGVRY